MKRKVAELKPSRPKHLLTSQHTEKNKGLLVGERVGVTGPALPTLEIICKRPRPSSLLSYFQRQHPAPGTHTRNTVCALLPPAGHMELILSRAQGNAICKFQLLFNSLPPTPH